MKARLNYYQRIIALFLAVSLTYATVTLVYALVQIRQNSAREEVLSAERLLAVSSTSVDGLLTRIRSMALALQTDRSIVRYATGTRTDTEETNAVDAETALARLRQTDQAFAIRLAKRGSATLLGDSNQSDFRAYLTDGTAEGLSPADVWREPDVTSPLVSFLIFGDAEGPVTPGREGPLVVVHQSHPYIQDGLLMLFEVRPEVLFAGVRGIEGVRLVIESEGDPIAASAPPLASASRTIGVVGSRSAVAPLDYRLEYDATPASSAFAKLVGPLALFFLLCLAGVWSSRQISSRLYAPVRRLLHALEEDRSTADSFEAAISVAEEFKRANRELRSLVEQSRLSLRDAFVRDVLLGTVAPEEIPLGVERHGVHLFRGPVIVCVCGVEESPGAELGHGERVYTIRQRLLSLFGVLVHQDFDFLTVGKDSSSSYLIFDGSNPSSLRRSLRRALDAMEREHGFRLYAAVSDPVASVEALPAAAQAVRALSLNSRLRRTYRLLGADQARAVEHGALHYSHDQEGQLIAAVAEMDAARVRRLLGMVAEENKDADGDLLDALRTTAERVWAQAGLPGAAPPCPAPEDGHAALVGRVVAWFDLIMASFAAREGEDQESHKGDFVRYIETHFRDNIGLAEMADSLNMSIGYASGLFRDLVGVNFKDYLRSYRIREAKRILESEEVLVKELARRVGYLNTQTFIRAFSRETGLSPGQYIRSVDRGIATADVGGPEPPDLE